MGNFKRFSGGEHRGGGRFNKGGFGGNRRDGGRLEMFRATCAECGNSCEVPFRPTGERPVYCSDCFGKNRGGSERGGHERRDFAPRAPQAPAQDSRIDDLKRQMESIQSKLDKVIGMLETVSRKPMATPEFYEKVEKIGTDIKTKKASAKKEKAASKKKK